MKKATTHQPADYHSVIPYLTVKDASGLIDFLKTVFDAQAGECMKRPDAPSCMPKCVSVTPPL